ncbi:hypothetical protein [Sulfitobacter sabulilitoris]|uniref:Uncharacterized protein n=1 Tax=Sulfitobacter sabulilitoris TaxID=2562655 RepID=A0A5S3PEU2_9RHOB|nr:hypothetical protein [Sulfitobacter sabulilitoris]TMM52489.1 hypothetical protein FDT80_09420 [Sulfitobacter sabulilitoris]
MTRVVILNTAARCITICAWIGYVAVLAQNLSHHGLGQMLYALAAASLLARVCSNGWAPWIIYRFSVSASAGRSACVVGLGEVVVCWGVLSAGLLGFAWWMPSLVLRDNAPAAVVVLGLGLALGLIRIASAGVAGTGFKARALMMNGPLPILLVFCAVLGAEQLGRLDLRSFLGLHLLATLFALSFALWTLLPAMGKSSDPSVNPQRRLTLIAAGGAVFRGSDILVLGWILPGTEAAAYLIARALVSPVDLVNTAIRGAMGPGLAALYTGSSTARFVSAAARVNLGILLIGGASVLGVLAIAPIVAKALPGTVPFDPTVMAWLVLAAEMPAIFGATDLLLIATRSAFLRHLLDWSCVPVMIGTVVLCDPGTAPDVAMLYAGVRAGHCAAAAAYLALVHRIWPGLTALMHRRLKML